MKLSSIRAILICGTAITVSVIPTTVLAQEEREPEASSSGAPAIVVTGSRIVRNGFDSPVPVTVVDSTLIQNLGQVNASDVVKLMPQNIASQSDANAGVSLSANAGSQFANLRGLNPTFGTRTLTLVNTRRFVATSEGGQVDLNLIPSVMIGRVETVTGGASAAYGSDAVAGVVNIILDSSLEGFKGQIDYGQTARADGKTLHGAAAWGTKLGDRGHFMIGGEYQRNHGIESCYDSRDWCKDSWTIATNEATIQPGGPNLAGSAPGTISGYNVPGSAGYGLPHYVIGRGGGFYSSSTGVIRNFMRGGGTSTTAWNGNFPAINPPYAITDFQFTEDGKGITAYNPGLYSPKTVGGLTLGSETPTAYRSSYIQTPMERFTTYAAAEYELTDALKIYGELTYAERKANSRSFASGTRSTMPIKSDNAFLPAEVAALLGPGTAFSMGKDLDEELDNKIVVNAQVFRGLIGMEGGLFSNWKWDVYYQYGQNNRQSSVTYSRHNDAFTMAIDAIRDPGDPSKIICRPLDPSVLALFSAAYQSELNALYSQCKPLNLFGRGNMDPAAVAFAWRPQNQDFKYRQHVLSGSVSGNLFDGWGAGPIGVAAGLDYRHESGEVAQLGEQPTGGYSFAFGLNYAGKIEVLEGFLETNVPVFRDSAIGKFFELNGAVRYTKNKSTDTLLDQSRSLDAVSWKVGGIYDVIDGVRLRATQSRDMRAAGFRELFQKTTPTEEGTAQGRVNNYFIAGTNKADDTPIYSGGNFTLAPEKADTTTAGIVVNPFRGFQMSLDWYQIKLRDAIANLSGQRVADLCTPEIDVLCHRITFSGSDRTNIVRVDAGAANVGRIEIRGFDFEASYRLPLADVFENSPGTLDFRFLLNHQYNFIVQQSADVPAIKYSGQSGPIVEGGDFYPTPKWMWNGVIGYSTDRFNATMTVRHVGKGILSVDRIGPEDPGYDPTVRNSITTNRVDSATYFNVAMSYKIPFSGDESDYVEVFGAIENLFDKKPPIAPGGGVSVGATAYPTNPVFFDTFGMRWKGGVRVRF